MRQIAKHLQLLLNVLKVRVAEFGCARSQCVITGCAILCSITIRRTGKNDIPSNVELVLQLLEFCIDNALELHQFHQLRMPIRAKLCSCNPKTEVVVEWAADLS